MAESSVVLGQALLFAVVALQFATAAFLLFAGPPRLPKRLLALFLAFSGFQGIPLLVLGSWFVHPENTGGIHSALFRVYLHANFLWVAAFLAFAWSYPARARLASWHAALLAGAVAMLGMAVAAWLAAPGLLWDPLPGEAEPGSNPTLLFQALIGPGRSLAFTLVVFSGAVRARQLAPERRRGALVLLSSVVAFVFADNGSLLALAFGRALTGGPFVVEERFHVPGDCCDLVVAVWLAHLAAPAAFTAWMALRERVFAPAALLAIGAGLQVPGWLGTSANLWELNGLYPALAALYVVARHHEFDVRAQTGWTKVALPGLATVLVAVMVVAGIARTYPDSPLAISVGAMLGLAAGALAGLAVAPGGRLWLLDALGRGGAPLEERLGPYRAALEADLARGADPDGLSERLRPLRGQLGVSDQEHAAMVVAMRPAASRPALQPGRRFLGRYRVVSELGRGGFGATYLCRDELVDREIVLKTLRSTTEGAEGLAAVLREARALGAVQHAAVVTLHDVQQVGDEAFIVMEHLGGGSLAARLASGPLRPAEFRGVAADLLEALGAVHARGIVHRDVKPSNVLLTPQGRAKLADFGVAHLRGFETTMGAGEGAVGTVRFMSPEQAKGRRATPQSDLFSAAAALYEAYTGKPYLAPHPGETASELQMRAARAGPFDAPLAAPPALRAWFARALDPQPERRFASADEMREALARALPAAA